MGNGRDGWLSHSRIERRDVFRRVVKRDAAGADLSERDLAASLGYTEARLHNALKMGDLACIAAGDVPLLCQILGSNAIVEAMAAALGCDLVPKAVAGEPAQTADILTCAVRVTATAAQLATTTTGALASGGISPISARAISHDCDGVRRAVNSLEAAVSVNVVEPAARSSR